MAIGETYVDGLISVLVGKEAIAPDEAIAIRKAFKDSEQSIFDVFVIEEGIVSREELLNALSEYYAVPSFDVIGYFFDSFLLHKFPKGFLLRNAIIPLEVDENIMIIVASEPDLPDLLVQIGEHVSYDIRFYVGIQHDICDAVKEFYDESVTDVEDDVDLREKRRLAREEKSLEQIQDVEELSEEELD